LLLFLEFFGHLYSQHVQALQKYLLKHCKYFA